MQDFDLIVLGSGAGLMLARAAAEKGLRTALIESDACGGTCLNRGCIPSKMLIYPCARAAAMRRSSGLNLVHAGVKVDFAALVARTCRTVDSYSAGLEHRLHETPGLELIRARASFVGPRIVEAGGRRLTAPLVLIATGSRPAVPSIPGLADTPYMTSRAALRRDTLPRRLLVIGGGYIAVELGFVYAAAGADVTFLVRSRLLRHEDPEIAAEFARAFASRHNIRSGTMVTSVEHTGGVFRATVRDAAGNQDVLQAEALLVAAGVVPETDGLNLASANVAVDEHGHVLVDGHLRTSAPGVYALGDVIGRHLYRHTANYEAKYLIRCLLEGAAAPLDYGPVPHAVFSDPEVAAAGMTEPQARTAGHDCVIGTARYADSTPGEARGLTDGLCKLIFDRPTRRLLGAHLVGEDAATLAQVMVAAMKQKATLDTLLDTIVIHPALGEILADAWTDARDRW
ncbi:MAG: NAD(P)/FAD-dependent oxidoreductase [Kiritimatiellia bacterium]|nr:dihydrolipoyl dehydrogenase [Lentisphaerota bacterium]